MNYVLRPYQERVIDQVVEWFMQNPTGHPVVGACVGAGKSIMIAEFVRRVMTAWPDQRILMAVHSRELLKQNAEKLTAIWPEAPLGIHSAGLNSADCFEPIIYSTIGSIWKKAYHLGRFDIALVDECHAIPSKAQGMYRHFIDEMRKINPRFRVIGWTGTPFRGDGVWLWDGPEPLFSGLAAEVSMDELLAQDYLTPLVNGATTTQIDASGVTVDRRTGDYVVSQLAQAADDAEITRAAVAELVDKGQDRRSWLVYCVTIDHAHHVCAEIQRHGIAADVVSSKTPKGERDRILSDFKSHTLRCIVNVAVLTTGFDHPATDLIALLRPTRSPVLAIQIMGRGMRTAPGKTDCMVLDFTDSTELLGPVNRISGKGYRPPQEDEEAPTKQCPGCLKKGVVTILKAGVMECDVCGYEFEPEKRRVAHGTKARDSVLLAPAGVKADTVYPRHADNLPSAPETRQAGFDARRLLLRHAPGRE
jgi:DNA repair protein RadD